LKYLFRRPILAGAVIALLSGQVADAADKRESATGKWKSQPPTRQELESKIAACSSKLERQPKDGSTYKYRAFAYYRLEQFDKASNDFEKAVQFAPRAMDAEAFQAMGVCYSQAEQLGKAVPCFSKAINLTTIPNSPDSGWRKEELAARYLRRAQALAGLNRNAEALLDANQIVKLANNKYWPLEFRARLNVESGHYKEALSDYSKAIKLNPNMSLFAERAKVFDKLGDKASAQRDRQRLRDEAKKDYF
jgi:tetratricopeptide (TPR) repeat protein